MISQNETQTTKEEGKKWQRQRHRLPTPARIRGGLKHSRIQREQLQAQQEQLQAQQQAVLQILL